MWTAFVDTHFSIRTSVAPGNDFWTPIFTDPKDFGHPFSHTFWMRLLDTHSYGLFGHPFSPGRTSATFGLPSSLIRTFAAKGNICKKCRGPHF
jgi:hypothetical protein